MLQIQQPEIETLIMDRLQRGGFKTVEDTLLQALKDAPIPSATDTSDGGPTGAEIIAAFQRSPHKEINIFPESYVLPVSDPVEF